MTENTGDMFVYSPEKDEELEEIRAELKIIQEEDPILFVTEDRLKKRIAKYSLEILDRTPREESSIMNVSHIVSDNFIWFNFEDELDEIMETLGELELPATQVSGDSFVMFEEVIENLRKYLG